MRQACRSILLWSFAAVTAAAHAQTMYKCGAAYQDRPCAAGTAGKAIGSTGASGAATPGAAGPAHAECAQRGRDSLRIVWSREGGATLERLLAEAATPEEKRFVQDVYRRPGAASTVQAAVEADCIAEKQRPEQAQREDPAPAAPPAAPAPPPVASKEKVDPKRHCSHYKAELERLRERERKGGSAMEMEAYAETRRQLRARIFADGC